MARENACRIVGGAAYCDDGTALEKAVRQIVDLDHRVYDVVSHGHIGGVAQWMPIFARHPETWRALADAKGDIVAYWQTAALNAAAFERARRGLLHPADICNRDYEALAEPGWHRLYFASVCIAPEWRTPAIYGALIGSFFEVAEQLAARGSFLGELAAVAHSPEGRRICETLGLQALGAAPGHGECFGGRFETALARLRPMLARRRPNLLDLYSAA